MKKVRPSKIVLRFTSMLETSDNRLWGCHFEVPKRIAEKLIDTKSRRVVCLLNNSVEYQCALIPHGNGTFVITVNKKLRDLLGLTSGMAVQVCLSKDTSEYGLPLPEEFQELLRQDKEGDKLFHNLTRGKQRTLLYICDKTKDTEKRVKRALTILNHLKANKGTINYKQLNLMLKDPRR